MRGIIIIAAVAVYARRDGEEGMSTENAAVPRLRAPRRATAAVASCSSLMSTGTIFVLLLILWVWITILNPTFAEPGPFLAYLKRSAPLVILAAGAYFVLISGNFDLSVGSLVTVMVVVAARADRQRAVRARGP